MDGRPPFHLAIEVHDLSAARAFYGALLGCREGRSAATWVDFDLYGHQLVCHVCRHPDRRPGDNVSEPVDGHAVPIPHFGLVMEMADWLALSRRLLDAQAQFIIEPHVRFRGRPGEQATMFLRDPSGNALEFKAFADASQLFVK